MPDDLTIAPEEMSSSGQDGGAPPMAAPPSVAPPDTGQPQPAPQSGQPPVQVMAAHPKAHIFSSLLNVLGGGNKTEYSVDPQTGTMQSISVPQTKGALAKSILAGALTGLLSGGENKPQPGREISQGIMRGAGAVQQKQAQQSQQAQQTATDDYNRQQQLKVRQMQTMEANMRMYALAQDIGRKDKEFQDTAGDQGVIDSYQDQGMVVNDNASGQEALDPTKYPKDRYMVIDKPKSAHPRTNDDGKPVYRAPDGSITTDPGTNNIPLYNHRYVIVDNKAQTPIREMASEKTGANTTVKTPGTLLPWVRDAQFYGIGGPQFARADNLGNTMSSPVATNLMHQVAGLDSMADELSSFAKKTGQTWTDKEGNQVDAKHYLQTQLRENPSLMNAIDQWRRTAAGGSTEPDLQILDQMANDPKAKSSRGDLIKLFGGTDKLEQYKEDRVNRLAGGKTAAETAQRLAAEQKDPKYQQQLANETQQLTNLKDADKHTRLENEKLTKDQASDLPTGPVVNGVDTTALKSLPVGEQRLAQTLMAGHMELTAQAMRTAFGAGWAQKLATIFPGDATHEGIDTTKFPSYQKARIDYTSGKSFIRAQAIDNALGHLEQYLDASDDIRVTAPGSHSLALAGTYGKVAQDKAKARDATIEFISSEAGKVTKGGVPDKDEIKRIRGILDTNIPSSSQSAAKQVAEILGTTIDSLQAGWENAVPFGMVSPLTHLMSPKAVKAYTALTGEKPNFGPGRPIEPTAQTGGGGQLIQNQGGTPPATLLKDGINTTFKNGQVWTLRNGQPAQVQ